MAKHNKIGEIGETIASDWLKTKGFAVLEMNYRKKWGEIDVVARKNKRVHFVEVKTVSYETKSKLLYAVTHETWRPEENVHPGKLKKLGRAIETWLLENGYEDDWQIDVLTVRLVTREKFARVKYIENVILE